MVDSDEYRKGWEDGLDRADFELRARHMYDAENVVARIPRIPSGWSGEAPNEESEYCPVADEIARTTMSAFRLLETEDRRRDLLVAMFNEAYRMGAAKGRHSPSNKSFSPVDPYKLGHDQYYRQMTKKYPNEPHTAWSELSEDERSAWRSGFEEFERMTKQMKAWLLNQLNENRELVGNSPLESVSDLEDPHEDAHTEHCCTQHGCKYGNDDCTVTSGVARQSYPCEYCQMAEDPPGMSSSSRIGMALLGAYQTALSGEQAEISNGDSPRVVMRRADHPNEQSVSIVNLAKNLVDGTRCQCHECWTERGIHDPKGCTWEALAELRAAFEAESKKKPFQRPTVAGVDSIITVISLP